MANIQNGSGERFSREQIERIWARVMPGQDPSEVIDLLLADSGAPESRPPSTFPMNGVAPPIQNAQNSLSPESTRPLESELRALLDRELSQAVYCCALSQAAPSHQARRTLSCLGRRCYQNAKSLSAALYLLIGKLYFPAKNQPFQLEASYLDSLRTGYASEIRLAEQCRSLGGQITDPETKALCEALSVGHETNALTLRQLIENCVG